MPYVKFLIQTMKRAKNSASIYKIVEFYLHEKKKIIRL